MEILITKKIKISKEDNIRLMARYPDKHFELAIVDPPYGIGDFRHTLARPIHKKIDWNEDVPEQEYFDQLFRVSKNQIIWGANYFSKYIPHTGRIVHDKTGRGKRQNPEYMSNCDIALHSFGTRMKIFHYTWLGNVMGNQIDWKNEMRWHPCQKPVQLYEWLLMNFANKGDKILDTHLGSGTIAMACHNLGFELTACETNEEYFNTTCKRIEHHTKQLKMF